MAVSGEFGFTTSNTYINGKVVYQQVPGTSSENNSKISVWVYLTRTNTGYSSYGTISTYVQLWANGVNYPKAEENFTIPYNDAIVNGSWKLVFAKEFTIPHNNDGSQTISITTSATSGFGLSFSAEKKNIALTKIPRYASINTWKLLEANPQSLTFSWKTDSNISELNCYFNGENKYSVTSMNSSSGTFTVDNLSEGTEYTKIKIKVKRKDSGLTTTSGEISGTTIYYLPTSTLSVLSTTINSIDLEWVSNYPCDAIWLYNGTEIVYSELELDKSTGTINLSPSNFDDIYPATTYSLSIKVRRKISQGSQSSSPIAATTLSLPTISSSTTSEFNIGDEIDILLDNYKNNAYTLVGQIYSLNELGYYEWTTIWTEDELIGTNNVNAFLPSETLFRACYTSNSLSCRIGCIVSNNSVTYPASYHYITAYVTDSDPVFNGFSWITNVGTNINNIIGGTTNMITGFGNLSLVFEDNCAIPKNYADIKYLEVKIIFKNTVITSGNIDYSSDGFSFDVNVRNIVNDGIYKIRINAIDSRGNRSDFIEKSFTVYPYQVPALSVVLDRQNKFESKTYISLVGKVSSLDTNNHITSLKYRYTATGTVFSDEFIEIIKDEDYAESSNTEYIIVNYNKTSDTRYFIETDISTSYLFQFVLTDELYESYVYEVFLPQGKPTFSIFESGHATVDKIPNFDSPAKLQVGSDIMATDKNGNEVLILEEIEKHKNLLSNKIDKGKTISTNDGKVSLSSDGNSGKVEVESPNGYRWKIDTSNDTNCMVNCYTPENSLITSFIIQQDGTIIPDGNIILNNDCYLISKKTDDINTPLIGINSNNDLKIGSEGSNNTEIYSKGSVYITSSNAGLSSRAYGENNVLWSGVLFMQNGQNATLSESVEAQPHGIVLAWSSYNNTNNIASDADWCYQFVPKSHINNGGNSGAAGITCRMMTSTGGSIGVKYVYVSNTTIKGHTNNNVNDSSETSSGIKRSNTTFVLRYVIGV